VAVVGVGGVGVEDTTVAAAELAVPLASAPSRLDQLTRICGGHCGHGERWFPCPPLLIWRCARRGPLPQERQAPPIRAHDGCPSI
jgi:hypothetical protein